MRSRKNPSVAGLPCCFCGRPAQSFGHFDALGMGGVGRKAHAEHAREDGAPVCGVDHSDPNTCHGAIAIGELAAFKGDGYVTFRAWGATARRLGVDDGEATESRYYGKSFDEIGAGA